MKITNTKTGKAYQLAPGTQIEIERPNLFFNEWGEQSYPVDLPDTDMNRELCGYPHLITNRNKPLSDIECTLQEGHFYMPCRMAVLGAKRKEKISVSFYMNEGSFLAKISDVALRDVFGDEVIPGITTVQQGIDFCWSLRDDTNPQYGIFPIIVDLDDEKRFVNRINYMDADGNLTTTQSGTLGFYNAFERTEKVDDRNIKLDPGYYISPFIRANYLLERLFNHFGYNLVDNFFTRTPTFQKMVFVNNTVDSLVSGTIKLAHLVPDCMCSDILNLFRKKFCCEFIPDEVARTVKIVLFNEMMEETSAADLTELLVGNPELNFEGYKQLKLTSEDMMTEGSSFESTKDIESKHPEAYYSGGAYYHTGYSSKGVITELLSDGNIPYYAGEALESYDVDVPETMYSQVYLEYYSGYQRDVERGIYAPYIGEGRTLNSTIEGLPSDDDEEEESEEIITSDNPEQKPVLSLTTVENYTRGTLITDSYSLQFNGPAGIFEKFYRKYDTLLRNSLHKVTATLLLTDEQKQRIDVHRKVHLLGDEMLVNILHYSVGGKNEPLESELLTTSLYEYVSEAEPESHRFLQSDYGWKIEETFEEISKEEYIEAGYEVDDNVQKVTNDLPAIYPLPPTEAIYQAGGKHYQREYYNYVTSRVDGQKHFYRRYWSLIPVKGTQEPAPRTKSADTSV